VIIISLNDCEGCEAASGNLANGSCGIAALEEKETLVEVVSSFEFFRFFSVFLEETKLLPCISRSGYLFRSDYLAVYTCRSAGTEKILSILLGLSSWFFHPLLP
jgi:hypothetical protein